MKAVKKTICFLLVAACVLTCLPVKNVQAATILPNSIYLTQERQGTCTLASATMMMRARMYLSGNSDWRLITEPATRPTAWMEGVGLRWDFTYRLNGNSMTVGHASVSGISTSTLKSILDKHPEGIVLYCGRLPHAVFLTDYEGDTFYCADTTSAYSGKRIPLASSYLGKKYGSQAAVLKNVTAYWYISSYSISGTGGTESCCLTSYAGTYICTTSSSELMIRSGHGTSYSIVGRIPSGAVVKVSQASGNGKNDWAHVEYNGIFGYASMGYLRKQLGASLTVDGSKAALTMTKGSKITLTATGTGGSGTYTYKFAVLNEETGNWTVLRDFGSESSYTTLLKYVGGKQFAVTVKDSKGEKVATNRISVTVKDSLNSKMAVDGSTAAISQPVGSTVTLDVVADGGSGGYTYKFAVLNEETGKWSVLKDFSSESSYTTVLKYAGAKQFAVTVKDSNGNTVAGNRIKVTATN